jgi:hypothetical protein
VGPIGPTGATGAMGPSIGAWTAFAPVVTSDGTAGSVQLFSFYYNQVGKTVFVKGVAVFGQVTSGSGGSFVKLSLPIAGKTGVVQDGIGAVLGSYVGGAPANYRPGWGKIVAGDEGNVSLTTEAGNFTWANAVVGSDFKWIVNASYETN